MSAAGLPRVVFVAGMHRAGTSAVARALAALGVDLGERLMSADVRQNARGFFEDVDVVALDDALLAAHGADWKSVALLDDVDWGAAALAPRAAAARALLAARTARCATFGCKDPRMARALPFWQHACADTGLADAYVVAVRHPRAVVDSLTARDALDPRRSAWLWLTHVACALRYTQGRRRVVVDYDRLLEAPARELARMAAALGLPPPAEAAARDYAEGFLSAELRHARYDAADVNPAGVPPLVPAAHALAQRLARGDSDPGAPAVREEIDALFARLRAFSPLLAYAAAAERAADDVPRLSGELAWARESLASAGAWNEDLRATVGRKEAEMRDARAYNEDLAATVARKDAELVAAHATLARLSERALGRMLLKRIRG
ncbi:MAG: hypothetical protein U1F58_10990 [Burkholderiales bacterium]